jgi:hypothetical protein
MIPAIPANSYRIVLEQAHKEDRLDSVLMKAFRNEVKNPKLQAVTRAEFKALFKNRKILIKGQPALASSGISSGTTYVDILGFEIE